MKIQKRLFPVIALMFLFLSGGITLKLQAQKLLRIHTDHVLGDGPLNDFEYGHDGKIKNLYVYDYKPEFLSSSRYYSMKSIRDYAEKTFSFKRSIKIVFAKIYGVKEWRYAISHYEQSEDTYYIIFDKYRTKNLSSDEIEFITAHEIGHLMKKHYLKAYKVGTYRRNKQELEGDFLAGYILGHQWDQWNYIKRLQKKAIMDLYKNESGKYPPAKERKKSFNKGFKHSKYSLRFALDCM